MVTLILITSVATCVHFIRLIRILVVDLLCSIDYEDCVENSVKQLTDSIKINVYKYFKQLAKQKNKTLKLFIFIVV